VAACRSYLDARLAAGGEHIYGINTGFGYLCDVAIGPADLKRLQLKLLLSHACGLGPAVPEELVSLMLLLKAHSLALGHSGVRPLVVERLLALHREGLLPVVYEQGSLGASGDLAPLAHLSLPLVGEGSVWAEGRQLPAAEALAARGLQPLELEAKEGLALLNGTQFMLAYALEISLRAQRLLLLADRVAALSFDAFGCRAEVFHPRLHEIRPHAGQMGVAAHFRALLEGSALAAAPRAPVQDPYSFRCIPQVHGASRDALAYLRQAVETELNAVSDNPNVFPEEDLVLSGGNFHGQPLALALDFAAIALAELGSISERRSYQLLSGARGLPLFLIASPGLDSGLMIAQYTAASLVSQNKQLCTPASCDSIPSSNNQEDHVSMGANAAVKCRRVLENLEALLSVELLCASQALHFRQPLRSSPGQEAWLARYREQVPPAAEDRYLHPDLKAGIQFVRAHYGPLEI
jgi:histidine ammonia-lyase